MAHGTSLLINSPSVMRLQVRFKALECTASNGSQGEAEETSLATSPSPSGQTGQRATLFSQQEEPELWKPHGVSLPFWPLLPLPSVSRSHTLGM